MLELKKILSITFLKTEKNASSENISKTKKINLKCNFVNDLKILRKKTNIKLLRNK